MKGEMLTVNNFIRAVKALDIAAITELLRKDAKWTQWSEKDGKNALHYLCGLDISTDPQKVEASLQILKLLLESGMDINSIHKIPDRCGFFPATPLWYAYTRGRNEKLYTYLLSAGADPNHSMFAIAWYDDVKAADLFKKYGAEIEDAAFLAAFTWKRFGMAEWFLQNGANVNFADEDGNTALHYAVKRNYKMEYIQLLLQFGADFHKENKEGMSPKKIAESNNRKKVLSLFESQ
ncbi:ankyrin repeat-containing protein [Paenibacillus sp. 32O-W]|nr:ankyrin repeat-containing protein [Paenibacillus sp. 32O-W]